MTTELKTLPHCAFARLSQSVFLASLLLAFALFLSPLISQAGSATWKASATNGTWNKANNWTPATIPNGPSDTASFATSNKTTVSLSANTEVDGITFNAGASPFTITLPANSLTLTISGVGITNNSGILQSFVASNDPSGSFSLIQFSNSATAGSSTKFTFNGNVAFIFSNSSTAGHGTFSLNGDPTNGNPSSGAFHDSSTAANGRFDLNAPVFLSFNDGSTADHGIFTLNDDPVSGYSNSLYFFDNSTAANAIVTVSGGSLSGAGDSVVDIYSGATAGNRTFTMNGPAVSGAFGAEMGIYGKADAATLIANAGVGGGGFGGGIYLVYDSLGGTSRVEVFGNATGDFTDGYLDIESHNAPGVTIGSIEGTGTVFLGANTLTVGDNNLSTSFNGLIVDGGASGDSGGSLGKVGKGKLTLTKGNTYTGGTTVSKGTLIANNKKGSATGTGPVQVNAGTLGGTGKISGAVTLGTGSGAGAFLSPGKSATKPGPLTISNNTLTFNSDSTYKCALDRSTAKATQISAKGVTINNAQFAFTTLKTGTLTAGTVFSVINNTAATPINGTFSNLADGSTVTSNGNTFKANYEGGDGNDLTLIVQ